MFGFLPSLGSFQAGNIQTQTAGTAITVLVPPMKGAYTHIRKLVVLAGSTAHNIFLLRPLNYTTTTAAAAASQAVCALTADPSHWNQTYQYPLLNAGPNGTVPSTLPAFQTANGTLTSGDYLVFETPDGAFFVNTYSSGAIGAVTCGSNFPTGGIAAGARVWYLGSTTSTDPATGLTPFNMLTTVSSINYFPASGDSDSIDLFQTLHPYDPILLYDANATAADKINSLLAIYQKF